MAPPSVLLWVSYLLATDSSSSSTSSNRSPWAPAEWRLRLNFGSNNSNNSNDSNDSSSSDASAWGASGARLALTLDVCIDSAPATTLTSTKPAADEERAFLGGRASQLVALEDPTFITNEGEQTVLFQEYGAWNIGLRRAGDKAGDASRLRFWMDLEAEQPGGAAITRNDVSLDPAERLYLLANVWREKDLAVGLERLRPLQAKVDDAQARLDAQLSHETGDRRLDGENPLDTALAWTDMAVLVQQRDTCRQELRVAAQRLPVKSAGLSPPGAWPGTTEALVVGPGTIGVKRRTGGLFGVEEFHVIGSFTVTPLEDEDEVDHAAAALEQEPEDG
jgi:hypothetical protein